MAHEDETDFPKLSAPARRALAAAGYSRLEQLSAVSEPDLASLHGIGLTAIASLRQALHERGLAFRTPPSPARGGPASSPGVAAVEEYLRGLQEPKRSTLEALRQTILEVVPEAEQVISYGLPAFRVDGTVVAGFAAFKNHLSYLPFSGSVLEQLGGELKRYTMTKSALHFPVDQPLPKPLVEKLIALRLAERGKLPQ
jgi:uncharacterized protein YdhG (YjbR/CyaY superfamily)